MFSIGGQGKWSDTAIVIKAANSTSSFNIDVEEILAKPISKMILGRISYYSRAKSHFINSELCNIFMPKDELEGKGKQIKGKIREEVGKLTDNKTEQLKGKIEQVEGKVQEEVGKVKRKVKE